MGGYFLFTPFIYKILLPWTKWLKDVRAINGTVY